MQRRNATLVQRVRIGAGFDEIGDHVTLRDRIPAVRARTAVGSVVKRLSSPSVTSANVGGVTIADDTVTSSTLRCCEDVVGQPGRVIG